MVRHLARTRLRKLKRNRNVFLRFWIYRVAYDRSPIPGRTAQNERLLARRELSIGGPDLPFGQPAAPGAAPDRTRQASPAGPLGHYAGTQFYLRALQPSDFAA